MTKTKSIYETPLVQLEAVSTEHGFAGSSVTSQGAMIDDAAESDYGTY